MVYRFTFSAVKNGDFLLKLVWARPHEYGGQDELDKSSWKDEAWEAVALHFVVRDSYPTLHISEIDENQTKSVNLKYGEYLNIVGDETAGTGYRWVASVDLNPFGNL